MQLTKNFTAEELCASQSARIYQINNNPSAQATTNLKHLATKVLQKIRDHFNQPVIITSGYRCKQLNAKIGGAQNSQHLTGEAADFVVKGHSVEDVFQWCKKNLVFDQLIQEKNEWVHISRKQSANRNESLRFDGKKHLKA